MQISVAKLFQNKTKKDGIVTTAAIPSFAICRNDKIIDERNPSGRFFDFIIVLKAFKGASARLLTRATHPFCRWKVSDTPVPSGKFHSTTQRDTRCYARYTRLRSCFPKGRGRHRCEGVRRKDCGSAEDVLLRSAEVSTFEVCKPIVNG